MTPDLSPRATCFLDRCGTRLATLSPEEIDAHFSSLGLSPTAQQTFRRYLTQLAGLDVETRHDSVSFVPNAVLRRPSEKVTRFSLEQRMYHRPNGWWLECVHSLQAVEPYYMDEGGRICWRPDVNDVHTSNIEKFIEAMALVNRLADWQPPWYQSIKSYEWRHLDNLS